MIKANAMRKMDSHGLSLETDVLPVEAEETHSALGLDGAALECFRNRGQRRKPPKSQVGHYASPLKTPTHIERDADIQNAADNHDARFSELPGPVLVKVENGRPVDIKVIMVNPLPPAESKSAYRHSRCVL